MYVPGGSTVVPFKLMASLMGAESVVKPGTPRKVCAEFDAGSGRQAMPDL